METLEIDPLELGITEQYRPSARSVFPFLLKRVSDM
jgi:hypothetical protein